LIDEIKMAGRSSPPLSWGNWKWSARGRRIWGMDTRRPRFALCPPRLKFSFYLRNLQIRPLRNSRREQPRWPLRLMALLRLRVNHFLRGSARHRRFHRSSIQERHIAILNPDSRGRMKKAANRGKPYSLPSVQRCSPHWHLNMRTVRPFRGLSMVRSSAGFSPQWLHSRTGLGSKLEKTSFLNSLFMTPIPRPFGTGPVSYKLNIRSQIISAPHFRMERFG
jgi:hypothetical protein